MSDTPRADFGLVTRQLLQVLNEMGTMRDEMAVLLASVQRLDRSMSG